MGLTTISLRHLEQAMQANGLAYLGLRMAELGNQYLYLDAHPLYLHLHPAKDMFTKLGVSHTSFDANGKDGVITCDLCLPLQDQLPDGSLFGACDVVTDFGTSEHVDDFYGCMKNIHDLCRVGGIMVRVNPKSENWPGHGSHYQTEEYMREFAKACGYEVQYLATMAAMGNTTDGWQIHATLKKVSDAFPQHSELPVPPSK